MLSGLLLTLHSRRSCSSGIEDGYPPVLCRRALIRQFWKMPKLGPVQTAHHPLAMGEGRWLAILFALYADTNPHGIKNQKGDPNSSSKFTGRGTRWPSKKEVTDNVRCLSLHKL